MSLVFIAVPTSGVIIDGRPGEAFLKNIAIYHRVFRDATFVVPMIQDYALLPFLEGIDATWEVWGQHCERHIKACDEVWVIQFDGWETSTGVQAEIKLARKFNKTLVFMRPCV